jgi:hypothetical protein
MISKFLKNVSPIFIKMIAFIRHSNAGNSVLNHKSTDKLTKENFGFVSFILLNYKLLHIFYVAVNIRCLLRFCDLNTR